MNICSMRIFYLKKTDLQNFSLYKKKKRKEEKRMVLPRTLQNLIYFSLKLFL